MDKQTEIYFAALDYLIEQTIKRNVEYGSPDGYITQRERQLCEDDARRIAERDSAPLNEIED